jgi:alkanesulfonate monooxygenase SsuD/methylene tetrahydromethanopterin reductase-like flavin-dependent oxidoreductase (luciferase family)
VRYGIYLPTTGDLSDVATLAEFARMAEQAGWDGCFIWDHLLAWHQPDLPVLDTTVALSAVVAVTDRIVIGPVITPLARRRPWKVAREMASLDRFSDGRMVLGVGLGGGASEWDEFGEEPNPTTRSGMLDEALDVITGLWSGEPFSHRGTHYRVDGASFTPRPVQRPRIPVWVCGSWPTKAPFRRAARWDGVWPQLREPGPRDVSPQQVADIVGFITAHRVSDTPFDVVQTNGNPTVDLEADAGRVEEYAAAGATWWVEEIYPWRFGLENRGPWPLEAMAERIAAGPPRR